MARLARAVCGGELIHATTRGNNRRWVFHCDYDRRTLLSHLAIVVPRYEWTLYAWCLMGNHYHLVVGGEPDALSSGMRDLNGCHARRMNLRYGRRDHQWGDRYSSTAITSEAQLLYEIRYVVTNPERTENPIRAERYFWSSYNACAGVVIAPPFLAVDHVHGALGAPCVGTDGAAAFREWIAESRKQLVLARPR